MHQSIYMVLCRSSDCYRRVYGGELRRRLPNLTLEGVDGDEQRNVVTYWYKPKEEY